jgi:hypothetical protein
MPFTSQYHEPASSNVDEDDKMHPQSMKPENLKLWLPSSLPASLRSIEPTKSLLETEVRLRIAQADDTLEEIRRYRRVVTGIHVFKLMNLAGGWKQEEYSGTRTDGMLRPKD